MRINRQKIMSMCKIMAAIFFVISLSIALGIEVQAKPRPVIDQDKVEDDLKRGDRFKRRKAARQLGKLDNKNARKALRKGVKDDDSNVSAMSTNSLGKLKDKDSTSIIIKSLNSDKRLVRIEAIKALGNIGDETSISSLQGMLSSDDATERVYAAESLGKLGDSSGLSAVLNELDNESYLVRRRAVFALKAIDDRSVTVVTSLEGLADNDENRSVRSAAHFVLECFGKR